ELIEGTFRTVLLRNVLHVIELAREGHDCIVSRGHLRREHCLYLVARLYALHHGEHEIKPVLVHGATMRADTAQLLEEAVQEVAVFGSECLQKASMSKCRFGVLQCKRQDSILHGSLHAQVSWRLLVSVKCGLHCAPLVRRRLVWLLDERLYLRV